MRALADQFELLDLHLKDENKNYEKYLLNKVILKKNLFDHALGWLRESGYRTALFLSSWFGLWTRRQGEIITPLQTKE